MLSYGLWLHYSFISHGHQDASRGMDEFVSECVVSGFPSLEISWSQTEWSMWISLCRHNGLDQNRKLDSYYICILQMIMQPVNMCYNQTHQVWGIMNLTGYNANHVISYVFSFVVFTSVLIIMLFDCTNNAPCIWGTYSVSHISFLPIPDFVVQVAWAYEVSCHQMSCEMSEFAIWSNTATYVLAGYYPIRGLSMYIMLRNMSH